jgi:HlyD family secretion protein
MKTKLISLVLIAAFLFAGCSTATTSANQPLSASGMIEATVVNVAPEVSGKVVEILAAEGDPVEAGAPLLRIEDDLIKAQRQKAQAGLEAAQATQKTSQEALQVAQSDRDLAQSQVNAAQADLDLAVLQYQSSLDTARLAEQDARNTAWHASQPSEFDLPVWYFQKADDIAAAQVSRDEAANVLKSEQDNLAKVVADAGGDELINTENRLVQAEQSFLVAKQILDQARAASNGADMQDYAQQLYDAADATLKSAQEDYNTLLSDKEKTDILEARARLAIAQGQYDAALDNLTQLQTGAQALDVQIAEASRKQSEANLAQAQAGLKRADANVAQVNASLSQAGAAIAQAQADLDLIDLQIERYTVNAPSKGVVLVRSVEPGEVIQAGSTALTIGDLDKLKVTVYIPEDRYGEVKLGQQVTLSTDSFPGETFAATVTRIADQAEFTPQNVQTKEGRQTTVYAIELSMDNTTGKLKPGMPVDVKFSG